jgi:hypothetical protein
MGIISSKAAIKIIINKFNIINCNGKSAILMEDFEYEITEGLCVLYNCEEFCIVSHFRSKKEHLPKSVLPIISTSKELAIFNDRGTPSPLPKKSIFTVVEMGDKKISITLPKGTKLQNRYTREEIIIDFNREVTVVC